MKRIIYLAGVMAVLAFPVFAESTITVAQCELEKIQLYMDMVDQEEVEGDQEELEKYLNKK